MYGVPSTQVHGQDPKEHSSPQLITNQSVDSRSLSVIYLPWVLHIYMDMEGERNRERERGGERERENKTE